MSTILLINPPHPGGKGFTREGRCTQEAGVWATQWPPLTLATAAALLEQDGHTPFVLDCPAVRMGLPPLLRQVEMYRPSWVFVSTGTPTLQSDLDTATRIKEIAPQTRVGLLGTHVTALPEQALERSRADLVVRGEPEETILELCRQKETGWTDGISFRNPATGAVSHGPDRALMDPEEIPAPAWHRVDLSPYRLPLKGRPFLVVAPLRGCPWSCSFCTAPFYYGRGLRERPVRQVVSEIETVMAATGVRDFFVWADTFTAKRSYVELFCREIRRLNIVWTCNSRVDTVDKELLREMKDAGLWMISFGIESADVEVLRRCGKRITAEQSASAVAAARQAGLVVSGHFIFGLPGETEAGMHRTLDFALSLPLDIAQFYAAAPFPGTELFTEAERKGWLKKGATGSQSRSVMDLPGLSADRVDRFRRLAFRRFYLRLRVLRRLLYLVEPPALKHLVRWVPGFLGWSRLIAKAGKTNHGTAED